MLFFRDLLTERENLKLFLLLLKYNVNIDALTEREEGEPNKEGSSEQRPA